MSYVVDTSSFIGAWVRTYPPLVFPGLWDRVDRLIEAGRLVTPEECVEELAAQDDDLHKWVKARADKLVVPTTRAVMVEARSVLAAHPFLTKSGTGRGKADPFVIALAVIRGDTVVTQERGGSSDKPRIPYVCLDRGVNCIAMLDVITAEGWRF